MLCLVCGCDTGLAWHGLAWPSLGYGGMGWGGEPSPHSGLSQQHSAEPPAHSSVVCSLPHAVLANRGSQITC